MNALLFDLLKTDTSQLANIENGLVIDAMKQDKKRIGNALPLILMDQDFRFFKITDFTIEEAGAALDHFKMTYC